MDTVTVDSPVDVTEINPQPYDQTSEDNLGPQDRLPGELSTLPRVAFILTVLQNW